MKINLLIVWGFVFLLVGCKANIINIPIDDSDKNITYFMKNVCLDTTYDDMIKLKSGGIDIITTEWGVNSDWGEVKSFLDRAQKAGLKVVMDGGFSAGAWGYDWNDYSKNNHRPEWNKELMQSWVKKFKDHKAVYAWDISNEFGENLPIFVNNVTIDYDSEFLLNLNDLKQAKRDILEIDSTKPILMRIHYWDTENYNLSKRYENDLVDIFMLNLYSNWVYSGDDLDYDSIISRDGNQYLKQIRQIDNDVEIWVSIAAFEQMPYFKKPSNENLIRDINSTYNLENISGIGFFGLGCKNDNHWYLFEDGLDLWDIIKKRSLK